MKYGQLYWQLKVHAFSLLEVEGGAIRSLCGKVRVRYPAYWQDSLVRSKGDFEARPCKSCKRLYLKIAAADALGERPMKAGDKVVSVIDDSPNVVLWVEARVLAHVYNEWEKTRYVGSVHLYREAAEGEYTALLLMGAST